MTEILFHPLADILPLIKGAEFDELVADIKANGLRDPIVLLEDLILDGRNRYRACIAAGVDNIRFEMFPADGDAIAYVISKNIKRRHLNDDQRRLAAARLANIGRGRPSEENPAECGIKIEDAAKMVNTDQPGTERARTVLARAEPEVIEAVEDGKLGVNAAAKASKLEPEMQRHIATEAKAGRTNVVRNVIKQEHRASREADLGAAQIAAPEGLFGVIVEDYEWDHQTWSEAGKDRHAGNHYPTSVDAHTADEIVTRTADRFACAADDCVLYMWATIPHLAIAIDVLRKRGFTYKSHHIWGKEKIITGYWSRAKHEVLLIGVKGNVPAPAMGTQDASLIMAPSAEHSAKPDVFMEMIERFFPTMPKLELNSRRPRPGWTVWGLDAQQSEVPQQVTQAAKASAMSPCTQGDGAVIPANERKPPHNSDEGEDVPAFLRRQPQAAE